MMIKRSPLSASIFDANIDLSVDDTHSSFVAPNVFSIAQSKVYPFSVPVVISADEKVVGFELTGKKWKRAELI